MSRIIVCSLSRLDNFIEEHRPARLITLMGPSDMIEPHPAFAPGDHLRLTFNDIAEPMEGYIPPDRSHVQALLAFAADWTQDAPLLIHCWAGVSRSTAAAYILWTSIMTGKADLPDVHDRGARLLRELSPTATPNPLLIRHADDMLGAGGAMIRAIAGIGRGAMTYEGVPFSLDVPVDR